jgi:hypothetical protein
MHRTAQVSGPLFIPAETNSAFGTKLMHERQHGHWPWKPHLLL